MGATSELRAMSVLRGVLTERDLPAAEDDFPGITHFFEQCAVKPPTFLDLVFAFIDPSQLQTVATAPRA